MKFSLSDQYKHKYDSFENIKDSILLIRENIQENFLF